MKKSNQITLLIALILVLITCAGISFWFFIEFKAVGRSSETNWIITDLSQYAEVRREWRHNQALIAHFPQQIPIVATDAHLMYSPPFIQKGANLQLRFKLPPAEIKRLLAEYGKIAIQKYEGQEEGTAQYMRKGYLPLPLFHVNDDPLGVILPKDYVIIVLGAEPQGEPDFVWNHGYTYGVAINETISEILYWAEDW